MREALEVVIYELQFPVSSSARFRYDAHVLIPPAESEEQAFYAYCEALLKLEWPGRRVVVTPAPFHDAIAVACDALGFKPDARGVVNVGIGPLSEDEPAFVCFRMVVTDEVSRRDWPGVANLLLARARDDFALWPPKS